MKVAQWCRWYQDEWDTWASLLGSGKVSYEQYLLELVWTLSGHLSCHPATIVLTGHMSSWLTVFVHQQVDLHCLCECDSVVNVIVCCGYTDCQLGFSKLHDFPLGFGLLVEWVNFCQWWCGCYNIINMYEEHDGSCWWVVVITNHSQSSHSNPLDTMEGLVPNSTGPLHPKNTFHQTHTWPSPPFPGLWNQKVIA